MVASQKQAPVEANSRSEVPLGFGLLWVLLIVLTARAFHLLGKQQMASNGRADP